MHKLTKGEVVGVYKLIEPVIYRNRNAWLCKCKCGNTVKRVEAHLQYSRNLKCECNNHHKEGNTTKSWKGIGTLGKQYFTSLKCRAAHHSLEFNITIEELWCKYLEQGGKCQLTGLDIHFCPQRKRKNGREQTASLDRIKSDLGYTIDNVQWVHKDINRMKNAYDQDKFIEMCKLVVNRCS